MSKTPTNYDEWVPIFVREWMHKDLERGEFGKVNINASYQKFADKIGVTRTQAQQLISAHYCGRKHVEDELNEISQARKEKKEKQATR